ncbi:two-component system VirA-like sensor kinase [Bradyrhizobium sp. 2S1]|uniref:two-component system VirA-like sensor kinase n=1 Tax=Bradyrhizobium sp. 2S1 TaxID=1404429 RepID=UPI00140CDFE5|nr:two-component system VirA-like sensor kinase [Bradyrhizobium sp. 2S1]MCK7668326.1 two-component system VirA-like sensor kinase [Bradyrhizobium sp. 2S1]
MRNLPFVLGVSFLLALLTWLLLRGIDTNASAYAVTLQTLDEYALAEASLHRDVLQARAGLLRDYDAFAVDARAMADAVSRLRSHARAEGLDPKPIDQLAAAVVEQEELLERFKTSNALLQNSLSYVGLLSTSPAFLANDVQLAPATGALAAAILYLSRDTSSAAMRALQEKIDQFAQQTPTTGPDAEPARAMLAHARLLYEQLPAVDETLKAFIAAASTHALEEVRELFSRHRSVVEAGEQRYRLLLYVVSLLLLVLLVILGLRLRARAVALRRRAAFEHVIAENSTRLINCSPAETGMRLKQVLGEFSRIIDADRAYVVLDERPIRVHAWSKDGVTFPPGWPRRALAVAEQLGAGDGVTIADASALPPGARDALAGTGVRAWACLPLVRPGRVQGIMGFDRFRPIRNKISPIPLARLASDAVANALEREFLERERTKLAMRLERARRMQMIGSLASGIAHNFNNIIGAILGYSEMAEPQIARGSKPAQHIDEIRRAAERGRDLVDNILTFGRRTDGRARPVQVRTLLNEAASLLRASLPSDVELVFEDVPADVAVSGEPAQLQQVILNLCTNAAQATNDGGCVRVAVKQEQMAAFVEMSEGGLSPGRYVCLSVSDNGSGIDERVARRMFEPFFTTRVAGTGLGLATVREIVRDHDGAINVQSEPGCGSRFEVWLPAVAADSIAADGLSALPLGRGETVLIVESERERLLRDEEKLAALGYEPVGFEVAADALAACRSDSARFDIILVGHASRPQGGVELARALHEVSPLQPVLLAVATAADVSIDLLTDAGISEVLHWPLDNAELAAALDRCLRTPARLQP